MSDFFNSQTFELEDVNAIVDPITLAAKTDDSIEYDFNHYEDPTLGIKPSNKSQLLDEVNVQNIYTVHRQTCK